MGPLDTAIKLAQSGDLVKAASLCLELLADKPDQPDVLNVLGVIANMRNIPSEAEDRLRRAISLNGNVAKYHSNLGNALKLQERHEEAAACYRRAIEIDPEFFDAAFSLAITLVVLGRTEESETVLQALLRSNPGHVEASHLLAQLLHKRMELEGALALLQNIRQIADPPFESLHLLGRILFDIGETGEAENVWLQAQRSHPENITLYVDLASLYEITKNTDASRKQAIQGLEKEPANTTLQLILARCDRHEGNLAQAKTRLEQLLNQPISPERLSVLHHDLGQILEREENAASAFFHFTEANRLQAPIYHAKGADKSAYLRELDELDAAFSNNRLHGQSGHAVSARQETSSPVFIVGFPRSGTTLLDQVLDSHPSLQTLEEKPVILMLLNQRWPDYAAMGRELQTMGAFATEQMRREYFELVHAFQPLQSDKRLVDKLPLNIVLIPAIRKLFPDAKFILALRHPCDVCLSCYMQMFSPNGAMANFLDLGDTVNLYVRIMGMWQRYTAMDEFRWHSVRYEDMVADFDGETRRLINFLDLPWHEEMRNFHEHAKSRKHINTPSYHQVTQPIYQHAAYRWQRYAQFFEPYMPLLEPFIRDFGYSD